MNSIKKLQQIYLSLYKSAPTIIFLWAQMAEKVLAAN